MWRGSVRGSIDRGLGEANCAQLNSVLRGAVASRLSVKRPAGARRALPNSKAGLAQSPEANVALNDIAKECKKSIPEVEGAVNGSAL